MQLQPSAARASCIITQLHIHDQGELIDDCLPIMYLLLLYLQE